MSDCIAYQETNYFSSLIIDYLNKKKTLDVFYNRFPDLRNFQKQIEEKQKNYKAEDRKILVRALHKQYKNLTVSKKVETNIRALEKDNTFTITTGHQLNLFTGPLYFLYKIISTVNLTEELNNTYKSYKFVPIYWMATEDHDFAEINFFNYRDNKISWDINSSGAVGELITKQFDEVLQSFQSALGDSENAQYLINLFKKAYTQQETLADATRYIVHELFQDTGLVILDANTKKLKETFIPHIEDEVFNQTAHKHIEQTSKQLKEANYKTQVNPRGINLFYLKPNVRERIIYEDGKFKVNNTDIIFTENQIRKEIKEHPERFSPNVIMRPLYQETLLPNLCYIGGGGELAYWFQLKSYFKSQKVTFPILLLRNSALIVSEKQQRKRKELNLAIADLFLDQNELVKQKTKQLSSIQIDFSSQKEFLKKQFEDLYRLANKTDKSFKGAVAAQEQKQINGLVHLEKRLLKAQKRKLKDNLERITKLQNALFPQESLQERQLNFAQFYEENGELLIKRLQNELKPLDLRFKIITLPY
ncbi:bacillithiol biosynthesis cysteine-adding enzyme BshC [Mesonia sp. HuA40]|uniref:bacillithiol biosynthesis cysteine-adding enzyme BshC n=1 Tax=Mesonia sp. HuA40 TaxID=2602761 RepID=UPI0011CC5BB6|nr:bacillithiol biosynthesis cysteine-adding enzyme BshC [Mesonia sp. HuA40]TXK74266.1 bacillithiol biosynthesis cysteine-adding enzyme BshC [Mesonia sp. HuA40]